MCAQEQTGDVTEEELRAQIKPLSENRFKRFFQKLYRKWLEKWYAFEDRHAKGAALLKKAAYFLVFSVGVTVWQYLVMTVLPYAFTSLGTEEWGWPNIPIAAAGGNGYIIFGHGDGLGAFIAFEIPVFTAQCINFPLQRNITYRSHGNPYVQALWYFIGWILVSLFTNALWGICNCFLKYWGIPHAVRTIGETLVTGLLSMVVFFFIFLIIFPDNEKLAQKARKKLERAKWGTMSEDRLTKMEQKTLQLEQRAALSAAEKAVYKATSLASATAMRYFSMIPRKDESEEEFAARKEGARMRAIEAAEQKSRTHVAMQALQNAN